MYGRDYWTCEYGANHDNGESCDCVEFNEMLCRTERERHSVKACTRGISSDSVERGGFMRRLGPLLGGSVNIVRRG